MECQSQFSGEKRRKVFFKMSSAEILPNMLCVTMIIAGVGNCDRPQIRTSHEDTERTRSISSQYNHRCPSCLTLSSVGKSFEIF